jgi:hypothetical protein
MSALADAHDAAVQMIDTSMFFYIEENRKEPLVVGSLFSSASRRIFDPVVCGRF